MNKLTTIKKLIKVVALPLVFGGLLLTNIGCKQIWGGGKITIKGKLVQDCSGAPMAGMPLIFDLKSHSTTIGGKSGTIGYDTTDQDGNFSVTGMNFGTGQLSMDYYASSVQCDIEGLDGSTVDLGTVYDKVSLSYAVQFFRQVNEDDDTLYYGTSSSYPAGSAVGKAINGHVFHENYQRKGTNLPYREESKWVWGIGKADYKRALDSLNAVENDHRFKVWPGVCVEDTVFVDLPNK